MKIDDKLKFDDFLYIIQNNCSLNNDKEKYDLQKEEENKILFDNSSLYTDENDNDASIVSDLENNKKKQSNDLRNAIPFIKK